MKYILWFLRIIVGVLFIFSGLVKANDPLGLSYKMNEFFEVWQMHWAMKYSLGLSVAMIGFEIIAGVALLVGYAFRVFSFLLLLLTAFFTFLTAYVYLPHEFPSLLKYHKLFPRLIEECGCFGDCIKISNAETFWKDVVLLVFVIILFSFRKRIRPVFSGYPSVAIIVLSAFFAFGLQWWTLEHLPIHDCLPYKIGNNIPEKMKPPVGSVPDSVVMVFIYEINGVRKEVGMDSVTYADSTWKFIDRKDKIVRKGNAEPEIKDFALYDYNDQNVTDQVLQADGYTFLLFLRFTDKARTDNLDRLKKLADQAENLNIPTYILSSSSEDDTQKFLAKYGLNKFPVYKLDATASKTALRSDPGLMLIEKGTIRGKWSFRDYPKEVSMNGGKIMLK